MFFDLAHEPREVERHRGAHTFLRIDADLSSGLAHEAVDHRQAEAGALAPWLGGEEWIERAGGHIRPHAGAGVGDGDRDILSGHQLAGLGREPLVGRLDAQPPASGGHGVARIDA